jgi:hypothetical protein
MRRALASALAAALVQVRTVQRGRGCGCRGSRRLLRLSLRFLLRLLRLSLRFLWVGWADRTAFLRALRHFDLGLQLLAVRDGDERASCFRSRESISRGLPSASATTRGCVAPLFLRQSPLLCFRQVLAHRVLRPATHAARTQVRAVQSSSRAPCRMDALRAVRASILQGRGTEGIPVRVLVWTRTSATPATGHKCRKHALTASLLFPAPAPHHDLPPLGRRRRPPSRLRACQAAADRLPACRLRHRPLSVRAPRCAQNRPRTQQETMRR